DPAIVTSYRERYGLNQPLLVQYGIYLSHLAHGDMGTSQLSGAPVLHELAVFVPATAELALTSMVLACAIGIPLGVIAALKRDSCCQPRSSLSSASGSSPASPARRCSRCSRTITCGRPGPKAFRPAWSSFGMWRVLH